MIVDVPSLKNVYSEERGEMTGFSSLTKAFIQLPSNVIHHNSISKLVIPSNSYNSDFNRLNLQGFEELTELDVGDNCFNGLQEIILSNLNDLERIEMGEGSMVHPSIVNIENLPKLKAIELGRNSLYCDGDNACLSLRSNSIDPLLARSSFPCESYISK